MTHGRRCGRGGFTLMETAVTILVMCVVAVLGYEAFTTLIDRRSQIHAAMAETERAAAVRATLEAWFARGDLGGPPQTAGKVGSADIESQTQDVIGFVTRAQNPSTAWAAVMMLFIDDNPSTPEQGLTVWYIPYSSGEQVPWFGDGSNLWQTRDNQLRRLAQLPIAHEIDRQVTGLRVEYLDRQTHRWFRWGAMSSVDPIAVRAMLEGSPSAPLPPLLQLPFVIWLASS